MLAEQLMNNWNGYKWNLIILNKKWLTGLIACMPSLTSISCYPYDADSKIAPTNFGEGGNSTMMLTDNSCINKF